MSQEKLPLNIVHVSDSAKINGILSRNFRQCMENEFLGAFSEPSCNNASDPFKPEDVAMLSRVTPNVIVSANVEILKDLAACFPQALLVILLDGQSSKKNTESIKEFAQGIISDKDDDLSQRTTGIRIVKTSKGRATIDSDDFVQAIDFAVEHIRGQIGDQLKTA